MQVKNKSFALYSSCAQQYDAITGGWRPATDGYFQAIKSNIKATAIYRL